MLVGWVSQRRWMTLLAFALLLVLVLSAAWLPRPLNRSWIVMPSLLVAAQIWERRSITPPTLRAALAIWMALDVLLLVLGFVFFGRSPAAVVGAVVAFFVLAIAAGGMVAVVAARRRGRQNSQTVHPG